ncbi:MAG: YtxH domain-containing protein [Saprospiraceae bacterium]|nr:YtxH domain-containing protein [Saprospiraceae bacterium]
MNSTKVLLGVLVSVAAGATLGILFAPDKGSSTRKKISQKSNDYVSEVEGKFNEFINAITQKFESVKKETTQMVENGKAKVKTAEEELIKASK